MPDEYTPSKLYGDLVIKKRLDGSRGKLTVEDAIYVGDNLIADESGINISLAFDYASAEHAGIIKIGAGLTIDPGTGVAGVDCGDYLTINEAGKVTLSIIPAPANHTHTALTNGETASIEELSSPTYLMTQERILPAFSENSSYVIGDYVSYLGKIYKCIINHSGAWNSSDFALTTLAEYILHHMHPVSYLDGVQTVLDDTIAEDYPGDLPTCGAVFDFVTSGVNAFLGMGVFTKVKDCATPAIKLIGDTALYKYTISGDVTLSFDFSDLGNISGKAVTFELYLTMPATAYTVTFPNSIVWLNNEIPSMSTPGKTYMFVFRTIDGGQSILASKEGAF